VADGQATGLSVGLVREADRAILTAAGAIAALDPDVLPDELLRSARHVHLSSLFLQPLLAAGAARLIERAHDVGASASIDTGWDPAEKWALPAQALHEVDVLLPNAEEAVRLAGTADDPHEAGKALAAAGPTVALKLGAEGAAVFTRDEPVELPAPAVAAVDTTGAGDSFDAGFIAGWLEGDGLTAALALGVACGALSTRAPGGTAAQPTLAEARALT